MIILNSINIIFIPVLLYYTYLAIFDSHKYLGIKKKKIHNTFILLSLFNSVFLYAFKESQNILVRNNTILETEMVQMEVHIIYFIPIFLFSIHGMFLRPFAKGKTEKKGTT